MLCPLCTTELLNEKDFEYFDCNTCKALVKKPNKYLSPQEEKKRYLEHDNDVNDFRYQHFTSPITNYVLSHFTKEHYGLDYGSGTGPVISKILERHSFHVRQYDPYFSDNTEVFDNTYDYIFVCEVAEHFYHPSNEFKLLKSLLKPKGHLIVMTDMYDDRTDFKNWYYRKDPTHVFIYRKTTFEFIKKKYKFKKLQIEGRRIILR
jgi:SAM-dependent methyltransferase